MEDLRFRAAILLTQQCCKGLLSRAGASTINEHRYPLGWEYTSRGRICDGVARHGRDPRDYPACEVYAKGTLRGAPHGRTPSVDKIALFHYITRSRCASACRGQARDAKQAPAAHVRATAQSACLWHQA